MYCKLFLADDTVEVFETNSFKFSTVKDMKPEIYSVYAYNNSGKLIYKVKRPCSLKAYKKIYVPSKQEEK